MAINLTGTWRGTYSFDHVEKLPRLPVSPIPFEMTLKQGWFGFISGTAQDDPKSGMAEPAKVRGRFKGGRLSIVKVHALFRVVHEGKFESPQQLADRYRVALDEFPPAHPRIRCIGTLTDNAERGPSFTGVWILAAGELQIPGSRALETPELRGTWTMKRV
jgi:hypothetical protein